MGSEPKVEVVLVEGSGAGPPDAPIDAGSDVSSPGHRFQVRPRTLVAGGLVVAAGLLATQAVIDARERAVYAEFADVRGVVTPLSPDVTELWRADRSALTVLWAGAEVDGMLVGAWTEESGAQSAVALDPRTGDVSWSVALTEPEEVLAGPEPQMLAPCGVTSGDDPLLVCTVGSEHVPAPVPPEGEGSDGGGQPALPGAREVVVVDTAAGEVLRREPVETDTGMIVLDDLVVTARIEADESIHVRATDARSGAEAWTFASGPGVAAHRDQTLFWDGAPGVGRVGDSILVQAGTGAVRLGPDGSLEATFVPADDDTADSSVTVSRGEHVLRHALHGGATVVLADDGTRQTLPGDYPRDLVFDDGSEPGLLLTASWTENGGLDAWDTATGSPRWQRPDVLASEVGILDGTAYVATVDGALVALDLDDGSTRWESEPASAGTPYAALPSPSLLTDGRVVALAGARTGESTTVQAFLRDDGRRAWAAELPDAVQYVWPVGHRVVGNGSADSEWIVLG